MFAIFLGIFASFWFAVSMVLINRGVLAIDYFRNIDRGLPQRIQ